MSDRTSPVGTAIAVALFAGAIATTAALTWPLWLVTLPFLIWGAVMEFGECRAAQAGEARRAETTGSVHEHAVPEGDAPNG